MALSRIAWAVQSLYPLKQHVVLQEDREEHHSGAVIIITVRLRVWLVSTQASFQTEQPLDIKRRLCVGAADLPVSAMHTLNEKTLTSFKSCDAMWTLYGIRHIGRGFGHLKRLSQLIPKQSYRSQIRNASTRSASGKPGGLCERRNQTILLT